MLIIRDAFRGTSRFDDFQASLGMARSVLTARLRKLTEQGVLERRAYSEHPPRYEYHLTDKGKALFPIIVSMVQWGDTWAQAPDGPPVILVHDACGTVTHPVLTCPHCNTEVSAATAHSEPAPGQAAASQHYPQRVTWPATVATPGPCRLRAPAPGFRHLTSGIRFGIATDEFWRRCRMK